MLSNQQKNKITALAAIGASWLITLPAWAQSSFYETGVQLDKKAKMEGTLTVIIVAAVVIGIVVFFVKKARKK